MSVDRLDHHLVLGELLQPPDEKVEPGLVPLVTVQVKELERSLEAGSEIISERLTPLSFRARDKPAGAIYYPGRNIYSISENSIASNQVDDSRK